MAEQTGPRRWPLVLIGLLAIGIYIYFSIEVIPPPRDERAPGTAADIAALAERDDVNLLFVLIDTLRADRMSAYGKALEPGQVVLAGSFIRPIEARKGDTIHADYGPWGSVSCYFS